MTKRQKQSDRLKQIREQREKRARGSAVFIEHGGEGSDVPTTTTKAEDRMRRLEQLERTVERSTQAVWDMACALKEIREEELWNETHSSWTAYCEDRWGISKSWANNTIEAVEVRAQLSSDNSSCRLPVHVKQTSQLARLPREDRATVWQAALDKAEKDGKAEPSLHKHLGPAIKEYREQRATPTHEPSVIELAREAELAMSNAADAFEQRVASLMPHLDNLPPDAAQGAAYAIVKTIHAVVATLEEHGRLPSSTANGLTRDLPAPGGREIHV